MSKQPIITYALPPEGYVRLKQILAPEGPIPVSRAAWWDGIKKGRFPAGKKPFGGRLTVWDVRDIRALLEKGGTA